MSDATQPSHAEPSSSGGARRTVQPVIGRERLAIEEELVRARELLRDGLYKLHESFHSMQSGLSEQANMLQVLDAASNPTDRAAVIERLQAGMQTLRAQSESAILGLQLEDVLGQLLEYTRRRADGLSSIAAILAEVLDEVPLDPGADAFSRLQAAIADADRRADDRVVSQAALDGGDVELF